MDEKEGIEKLEQELQWVNYRQKILEIIESKLVQMREITLKVKKGDLTMAELELQNKKINRLLEQVRALDGESRRTEDEK